MTDLLTPQQRLEQARARLVLLRDARSEMILAVTDGVQQIRMPDGSGVTFGSVPDRLSSVEAVDREISKLEQAISILTGEVRRRPIRQVRTFLSKGL